MGARHAPLCPCSLSPSLPLCSGLCCVCISLSLWLDFHRFPAGLNHVAPSQEGWFDEGLLDGKAASLKGKATGTLTVSSGTIAGEFRHRLGNAVVKGSALPGSVRYLVPLEGKHTWPDGKLQPSVPPRPVPQTRSSCLWNRPKPTRYVGVHRCGVRRVVRREWAAARQRPYDAPLRRDACGGLREGAAGLLGQVHPHRAGGRCAPSPSPNQLPLLVR